MTAKQTFHYLNPWSADPIGKPEFFSTQVKPVQYRGFQIFHRHAGVYELVKDGVCLTQRGGGGAMKSLADALLGDKSDHPSWMVKRSRDIGTAHGVKFAQQRAA